MIENFSLFNENEKQIAVRASAVEVSLNDSSSFSMILQFPPIEELKNIDKLSFDKISIKETLAETNINLNESYEEELARLLDKYEKYKNSPTFLNHIAVLNQLSSNLNSSEKYFTEILKLHPDPNYKIKIALNYIKQNNLYKAKEILNSIELKDDVDSNIILSLITIKNGDYIEATCYLDNAIKKDFFNFQARLIIGTLELIKGNYNKSIRHFKIACEERDNSSILFSNMAIAYYFLNNIKKSLDCYKRSVYLNPLNKNAVINYCDLLIENREYSKAISTLNSYLTYDQKDYHIWDRLAKAYYKNKEFNKALESLKNQASIEKSVSVWNNMALVYWAQRDIKKSNEYFGQAFLDSKSKIPHKTIINNYFNFLLSNKRFSDLLKISEYIVPYIKNTITEQKSLSYNIIIKYIIALFESKKYFESISEVENVLSKHQNIPMPAKLEYLSFAIFNYTLITPNPTKASYYSQLALQVIENEKGVKEIYKARTINNIIFNYLEFDNLEITEKLMKSLYKYVYRISHPTATLGLYYFKKGNIDKARELYENAIKIETSKDEKSKIKQKYFLELGKFYQKENQIVLSQKYFKKAIEIKNGYDIISKQAKIMLSRLVLK